MRLLECRLDTVVYRLGFAPTISSPSIMTHSHFLVDGKKVNIPSFMVQPGMKITVREKSQKIPMIAEGTENPYQEIPPHLSREAKSFEGHVVAVPAEENLYLSGRYPRSYWVLFEIIILGIIIEHKRVGHKVSTRFFVKIYVS